MLVSRPRSTAQLRSCMCSLMPPVEQLRRRQDFIVCMAASTDVCRLQAFHLDERVALKSSVPLTGQHDNSAHLTECFLSLKLVSSHITVMARCMSIVAWAASQELQPM